MKGHGTGGRVPRGLSPERLAAIAALAWRPAWSIRRRVGCLAPLADWWRERRRAKAAPPIGETRKRL